MSYILIWKYSHIGYHNTDLVDRFLFKGVWCGYSWLKIYYMQIDKHYLWKCFTLAWRKFSYQVGIYALDSDEMFTTHLYLFILFVPLVHCYQLDTKRFEISTCVDYIQVELQLWTCLFCSFLHVSTSQVEDILLEHINNCHIVKTVGSSSYLIHTFVCASLHHCILSHDTPPFVQ